MSNEPDRSQRKALGKGLSALLSTRSAPAELRHSGAAFAPALDAPEPSEAVQNIALDHIEPSAEQPRDSFDAEKLQELAQSIRANGLIQPIAVQKIGPGKYRIIAGERRWRAARLAGLTEIPALVRSVEADQLLELALIENIQREDLNPVEIALAFQRLTAHHGLSHEEIARRTGKDRTTITNFLRLLRLSAAVRNELAAGAISTGHARALLNVTDEKAQAELCERIVRQGLSVRDTEKLVKNLTNRARAVPDGKAKGDREQLDPNVRAALEEMSAALGTRVRLIPKSETTGRIEIDYYSQDDLDRIYSTIVKQ